MFAGIYIFHFIPPPGEGDQADIIVEIFEKYDEREKKRMGSKEKKGEEREKKRK